MTNIDHNNRTEKELPKNVDKSRVKYNKVFVQENIKDLYKREFSEALEKYNAKQTRADRKIKNYYNHISKSKKTALQQEIILQIGDWKDFKFGDDGWQMANDILEEYYAEFEERNPSLKVYNAIIHNDEKTPHLHINFVPVATGYKRGLESQVAFDRAIKQDDSSLDKARPFEDWRKKEVAIMEKLLNSYGVERKKIGTKEYKDINAVKKATAELEEIEDKRDLALAEHNRLIESNQREFESLDDIGIPFSHKEQITQEYEEIEVNWLGKERTIVKERKNDTGNVVLTPSQFDSIKTGISSVNKLRNEYDRLKDFLEHERVDRKRAHEKNKETIEAINGEINERADRLAEQKYSNSLELIAEKGKYISDLEKRIRQDGNEIDRLNVIAAERDELKIEVQSLRGLVEHYKQNWDVAINLLKEFVGDRFNQFKNYFRLDIEEQGFKSEFDQTDNQYIYKKRVDDLER